MNSRGPTFWRVSKEERLGFATECVAPAPRIEEEHRRHNRAKVLLPMDLSVKAFDVSLGVRWVIEIKDGIAVMKYQRALAY